MSSVVQNLLDAALSDGARASKFECQINFKDAALFPEDVKMHVKTSQFPGKTHEVIDYKFKGRTVPLKGQVKYDTTWSCTFYMDENHKLRSAFLNWIESLDQVHNIEQLHPKVEAAQKTNSIEGYNSMLQIFQLNFAGESKDKYMAKYDLYNAFPKSVSAVDVDYSSVGSILEFTVEFAYSHFILTIPIEDKGTIAEQIAGEAGDLLSGGIAGAKGAIAGLF
ncbi:MAG: hypothetical protein HQ521_12245 [Bacteroidetes bacterium]|nr:hypothetical protein [Bacteroidota bacterium]